jgi:hypothetical protein
VECDAVFGDGLLAPEQVAQRDRLLELHATEDAHAKPAQPAKKQKELEIKPDPTQPAKLHPKTRRATRPVCEDPPDDFGQRSPLAPSGRKPPLRVRDAG